MTDVAKQPQDSDRRLFRWQGITLGTLFTGYVGYYVCRANLSVSTLLIVEEYQHLGISKQDIGRVASIGVAVYSIGKITNGLLADYIGGRLMFLFGIFASALCTLAFGLASGMTAFTVIWGLNRYVQSMGWVALVKTSSRWYPFYRQASIMGILSMSYLVGGAAARAYLGGFIWADVGWRGIFFIAAGTLAAIGVAALFTLKSSPEDVGLTEPSANPMNAYGADGDFAKPGVLDLLTLAFPLFRRVDFWLICLMNVGLTLIRETFNFWTPTFLAESTGLSVGGAAISSLLFPLVGALSALSGGLVSDRLGGRHGRVVVPALLLLILALGALATIPVEGKPWLALTLVCFVSFFLIAPYSFLSGVMAVDLGGKRGSSTTAGLVDSAGYLFGGYLSGEMIGAIADEQGWSAAFGFLAIVSAVTALVAVAYWLHHEYTHKQTSLQQGESTVG